LRPLHLLGEGEGASVQRVGELLVVLGDHARAGAARPVELDQLGVQQGRDLGHRAVQLGREAAADAPGPVGDLHAPSSSAAGALCSSASAGALSTWPSAAAPPGSAPGLGASDSALAPAASSTPVGLAAPSGPGAEWVPSLAATVGGPCSSYPVM